MNKLQAARKYSKFGLFIFVAVFYLLLLFFPDQKVIISDILTPLGILFSLYIISTSIKWHSKEQKKTWLAFWLGNAFFLIGEIAWFCLEVLFKQEVVTPTICDLFFILSMFCYIAAMLFYINISNIVVIVRTKIDIMITLVVYLTLAWDFIVLPIYKETAYLSGMERLVTLLYPIMDICYFAGIVLIIFAYRPDRRKNLGSLLIIATFVLWFVINQIYTVESASGTYLVGSMLDPLWPVGHLLLAVASLWSRDIVSELHPEYIKVKSRFSEKTEKLRHQLLLLLPYISFCLLIVVVSIKYFTKDPLIVGIVITALLIIARQVVTLSQNQRLISLIQESNQSLEESKQELEVQNIELQMFNYLKEQEAQTDFLTGLYNRRYINQKIKSMLKDFEWDKKVLSVLLIDVDKFKQINDQWGHDVGDMVLKQIAIIIKDNIRSLDIAGRYGGDEFIILLPDTNLNVAKIIGERLRTQIDTKKFMILNKSLDITLSIGGTQWQESGGNDDIKLMIERADMALYEAKNAGRNRVIIE